MDHPLLYRSFVATLLQSKRGLMSGTLELTAAIAAFDTLQIELEQQHSPETVKKSYLQFEADLKLLRRLEWLGKRGSIGQFMVAQYMNFINGAKLARTIYLMRELQALEGELAEADEQP